jgi:uroporphyrinogen-III synthase
LATARPQASWAASQAIATHPRIAERVRECGFGVIHETRPTLGSVVGCIQSLAS